VIVDEGVQQVTVVGDLVAVGVADRGERAVRVHCRACALNPRLEGYVYPVMETSVKRTGKQRPDQAGRWLQLGLRVAGAALLAVSAGIHLDLYLTGYRSIPTIGWLFLLQVIAGFALAAAVLATRSRLAAAAAAGFALSTLGGYLLSVWIGLFGFKEVRTTAGIAAGLIEVAAFAALALATVAGPMRQAGVPASPGDRLLARVQAVSRVVFAAVGAVSVLAVVLLGVAVAGAVGSATAATSTSGASVTLKTAKVGGVSVLTSPSGLTLYWFAPDTANSSKCTGSCAAYWPPVTGTPKAGPGVTGRLGTIKRPDGSMQATYDGHPLYTYVGDSGPGQAHGNNLNLNGGLWYEVRVSG
jgi:predicted lipoprotein with Yx(FWY)xxD motif